METSVFDIAFKCCADGGLQYCFTYKHGRTIPQQPKSMKRHFENFLWPVARTFRHVDHLERTGRVLIGDADCPLLETATHPLRLGLRFIWAAKTAMKGFPVRFPCREELKRELTTSVMHQDDGSG